MRTGLTLTLLGSATFAVVACSTGSGSPGTGTGGRGDIATMDAAADATGTGGASTGAVASGGMIGGTGTGGRSPQATGGNPAMSSGGATGSGGKSDSGTSGSGGVASGGASGGARAASGGQGGAGSGGMAGKGGASPTGGASGGGSAGSAPSGDDRAAVMVLDGFTILKPCGGNFKPTPSNGDGDCCCDETAQTENQHITKQVGGDPAITYDVKLRVAGVAERYWYAGGALDPSSKLFYTGGLPTIHGPAANNNLQPGQGACKIHPPQTDGQFMLPFTVPAEIRPADGCYNGFNIFAVTVSSPKQSYYFNDTTDYDGVDRQPHKVYKTDYTVTIPISGGATLDFYTIDGDHHQVTNDGTMTVPNVKTQQPYNGNFLELTVVDVSH